MPALSFAELSVVHDENKDGGKTEIGHVDAGAVQMPITGQVNAEVKPGAFTATGTATTTFNQPLGTMKVDAPMTVAAGAVPVHFELNNFPHGLELVHMDENAVPVNVKVNIDLGPVAAQVAALIQPVKEAEANAKKVWDWRYWILTALAALGVGTALWLHGRNRGHKATIVALTKIAGVVLFCALSGCADTIFTATGALAPKVAMGIAAAGAVGTLAKSAVDGVSAIEELKAEMQGKTPHKDVGAASSSTGSLVAPAQTVVPTKTEVTK